MYRSVTHHPPLSPVFHPLQNIPKSMYNDYQLRTSSLDMASGDYLRWSNYVLDNLLPCSLLQLDQTYFQIVSKIQLESIRKATVVQTLTIYGVRYNFPVCFECHIIFVWFAQLQCVLELRCSNVWLFRTSVCVGEINQLLQGPYIRIQGLELVWVWIHIVAIQQPVNHNQERSIWQLWQITSGLFAHTISQICCRWLDASASLFPCLVNFPCTFLLKHLHPLPTNWFGIINIIQW